MYAIDRCGRRMLLAISSAGVMIGMLSLGVHFLLLDYDYDPGELEWLAILSLQIFALLRLGLVPVPSTMLSELFPCDLKSAAGFVGSATSATFAFASIGSYRPLVNLMGEQYVFWIYAAIVTVCLIYTLARVPETKGKTLQVNACDIDCCNLIMLIYIYVILNVTYRGGLVAMDYIIYCYGRVNPSIITDVNY